ncbi:MAG: FxLYD domain-containing protein [Candidatus Omnitrophica bacterium]|nr:FxLYD domain-containing protein [Candidatus Omnitrophota bacterium]
MKKLYIAIGVLLLVFLAIGCSGSDSSSDNAQSGTTEQTAQTDTQEQEKTALTLVNVTLTPESYGGYSAKGTAIANKDLSYAQINAQFFDKDGALVYNSLTNVQNIKAGTQWKYTIPCIVDKSVIVATCNVTEGTCY